ncbi:MAG: GyrI-like domain-containing protein [Rhizobiales bacterium]|nr:GyrI-like domain-containing protein [Hyphomicrobiales bacterium]
MLILSRIFRCQPLLLPALAFCASALLSGPILAQAPPPAPASPTPAPPIAAPTTPDINRPSADASTGREVELQPQPMIRLRGQSTWDDGFETLKKAIKTLEEDARRLGLAPVGQPKAHFISSDDLGFTFEAFLPLAAPPAPGLAFSQGVEAGVSPAGRAMYFTHEGPYEEIDAAYEAITAFMEEKSLAYTGKFLEEYLVLPEKSDDPGMKLNIYVFLR